MFRWICTDLKSASLEWFLFERVVVCQNRPIYLSISNLCWNFNDRRHSYDLMSLLAWAMCSLKFKTTLSTSNDGICMETVRYTSMTDTGHSVTTMICCFIAFDACTERNFSNDRSNVTNLSLKCFRAKEIGTHQCHQCLVVSVVGGYAMSFNARTQHSYLAVS